VVQEVSKQTLAALKFSEPLPTRPLAIIAKKTKVLSPAMKQFIQLLKEPL
jgi:hypothetical protein